MKIVYAVAVCLFLGACSSPAETPKDETPQESPKSEAGSDGYVSVALGPDIMARYKKGAYVAYSDSIEKHAGHNVLTIKSINPEGFSPMITSIEPRQCLGKRVEYTAWVKAKDIKGAAGLWLRIDPKDPYKEACLGFDNMSRRPITGTSDWTRYHVVLDVPENAASLVYGILLHGDGQVWIDSMDIKIVDKSVARTDSIPRKVL